MPHERIVHGRQPAKRQWQDKNRYTVDVLAVKTYHRRISCPLPAPSKARGAHRMHSPDIHGRMSRLPAGLRHIVLPRPGTIGSHRDVSAFVTARSSIFTPYFSRSVSIHSLVSCFCR